MADTEKKRVIRSKDERKAEIDKKFNIIRIVSKP